ncbi:hypothetical protein ACFLIN_10340 [Corynebacterium kutscheri]|nr:hypothetical protein [Corynebacterium kutscheri]
MNPILEFFSTGIGKVIADVLKVIYTILYPSNADSATKAVQ